jgi:hypothetical protein
MDRNGGNLVLREGAGEDHGSWSDYRPRPRVAIARKSADLFADPLCIPGAVRRGSASASAERARPRFPASGSSPRPASGVRGGRSSFPCPGPEPLTPVVTPQSPLCPLSSLQSVSAPRARATCTWLAVCWCVSSRAHMIATAPHQEVTTLSLGGPRRGGSFTTLRRSRCRALDAWVHVRALTLWRTLHGSAMT